MPYKFQNEVAHPSTPSKKILGETSPDIFSPPCPPHTDTVQATLKNICLDLAHMFRDLGFSESNVENWANQSTTFQISLSFLGKKIKRSLSNMENPVRSRKKFMKLQPC